MIANILIVDDEKEISEMLSRHFTFLDYKTFTAKNGNEALQVLRTHKIDILISDIMMPEMSGVELLKAVRSEFPMIRPIMITGYVTLENILSCIRYGADYCIFKPITDLGELEKAVSNAAQKIVYWHNILKDLRGLK